MRLRLLFFGLGGAKFKKLYVSMRLWLQQEKLCGSGSKEGKYYAAPAPGRKSYAAPAPGRKSYAAPAPTPILWLVKDKIQKFIYSILLFT
jgi:hypothetical protein